MLPAATRVTLLARAMTLPFFIAEIVGASPLNPTIAARTMSTLFPPARSPALSTPANTFMSKGSRASLTSLYLSLSQMTTAFGLNCLACWMSRAALLPADSISTWKRSWWREITSRAWVPMDPVDPSMAILLFCSILRVFVLFFLLRDLARGYRLDVLHLLLPL